MKKIVILIIAVYFFSAIGIIAKSVPPSLLINISSPKTLNGTAGDFVTVNGTIANVGSKPMDSITTYLSLADTESKLPVDLEDWSVEKGLYIGTIDAGQKLPLNWKIHFVKAGTYSLVIIAEVSGDNTPQISDITQFNVSQKKNLNPNQVLPVALGTPIVIIFFMFLMAYKRRTEEK
jgi:hypothetical protein